MYMYTQQIDCYPPLYIRFTGIKDQPRAVTPSDGREETDHRIK